MKPTNINLLNSCTLILFGIWGYVARDFSGTALIPVIFGVILLLCNSGIKKENKIISHIAVTFTLLILIALFSTRLEKSISDGGGSLVRIVAMLFTGTLAMISFIKSFIKARKKQ